MKLPEITTTKTKGSYAALRVLEPTASQLYKHCDVWGIPAKKSMFENRLHTTLIYSRKYCPDMKANPDVVYECQFKGYDIFKTQTGDNALVLLLSGPGVVARHLQLMAEHGATYDYPTFTPHITLSYTFKKDTTFDIPPINFPILLGKEYVEDLELDWAEKNG